jgi:hypothetical protein
MIKVKPEAVVCERENMAFEITAFMPYLTRLSDVRAPAAVTVASTPAEKRKQGTGRRLPILTAQPAHRLSWFITGFSCCLKINSAEMG